MAVGDPVEPFDATVGGALAHVSKRRVTATSQPSTEDVHRFVEDGSRSVAGRVWATIMLLDNVEVGTDGLTEQTRAVMTARAIVHLYAAAMTEDAAYPENASPNETAYGTVLWNRHRQLLADLLASLGISGDAHGGPHRATSLVTGPEPAFTRSMRW